LNIERIQNMAWNIRARIGGLFKKITSARKDSHRESKTRGGEPVGIYLDPFETNFILRPIFSFVGALGTTAFLYGLQWLIGSHALPLWARIPTVVLLSCIFAFNDSKPITVPKQYVAILTFFGMRFNIYFEEGDHYWYGMKLGFGRSTDPLPHSDPKGKYPKEAEGFVYIGSRPIGIWPNMDQKDKFTLSNVAHDSSTIYNALTVTFKTVWPLRYANSDDPILDIAERARSALRTVVSFFVGADNAMLKSVTSKLLEGQHIVTAFTFRAIDGHPAGSVIQDRSGDRIFEIVPPEGDLEEAKRRVRERIDRDANPLMREVVLRDNVPVVQHKEVADHLIPVTTGTGTYFERASVSDVTLSEEVAKQANIAAGEYYQRVAQIENAKVIKAAQDIMKDGVDTEDGKFATLAALARDGHAKIVYVPDSDRLTRAAVAGAQQIGEKK
jgi:hypothetical protein